MSEFHRDNAIKRTAVAGLFLDPRLRRARFDPNARGTDCAAKRDNVIGARDERTTHIRRPKT
jgi:hypothetical protein